MKNKVNPILFGFMLASSGALLTACSGTNTKTDSETPTAVAQQSSEISLQAAYEQSLLAHRNSGVIAVDSFESKVRQVVRSELNLDMSDLESAVNGSETQGASLLQRLNELDQKLEAYKHASFKGSEFEQLWSLIPALPVLEERKALKLAVEADSQQPVVLKNDRMAELIDLQLNSLFNSFVISVDALTPETQVFESQLKTQLKAEGLNVSARRPSLILQYFVEAYEVEGGLEVIGDFEFKDRDSKLFKAFSTQVNIENAGQKDVRQAAFERIAKQLSDLMLEQANKRITDVNNAKQ
ncbi:hypothetical protein [Thiomicrorhabdus indica]|uniref:hypothetical protein n=1 Tax=Thiomicrorhabdus indica TaxID=2267253 RepID=UPI00102DBCDB|nr:hypothetical protein [Thiomicrorhabdus indica]